MPRDGSNIYHYPTAIEGIPNQVIESADYNSLLTDLQQDLNLPRPIIAGGTGAVDADAARTALGAEKAGQVVTNYDSQVWVAGSFRSDASATGAPVTGHAFSGIAYLIDTDNITIEARDQADIQIVPARKYIRQKRVGIWSSWAVEAFMPLAGGPISGNLTVLTINPTLTLDKLSSGQTSSVAGYLNGLARWRVEYGDGAAEGSQNNGSDFVISRYNDAGALLGVALTINRGTGNATFGGSLTISGNFTATGTMTGTGHATRTGLVGIYDGAVFNITSSAALWINSTNLGTIAFTSDYRTKKDVNDLPRTWNIVKELRPISYRQRDFGPLKEDNSERWGFIAHELQDTMVQSAATGSKDSRDYIQSPNPWTVIAALTKALQEAMTRIEVLESR